MNLPSNHKEFIKWKLRDDKGRSINHSDPSLLDYCYWIGNNYEWMIQHGILKSFGVNKFNHISFSIDGMFRFYLMPGDFGYSCLKQHLTERGMI